MQISDTSRPVSASFDDPNLVSSAGLVPMMVLAVKTVLTTPIIIGSRPGKGPTNSARGAKKLVSDILTTVKRLRSGAETGPRREYCCLERTASTTQAPK